VGEQNDSLNFGEINMWIDNALFVLMLVSVTYCSKPNIGELVSVHLGWLH